MKCFGGKKADKENITYAWGQTNFKFVCPLLLLDLPFALENKDCPVFYSRKALFNI